MPKNKNKITPLPKKFLDEKEAGDFWETHSVADYWDEMKEAHFDIEIDDTPKGVALEYPLAQRLSEVSKKENLSIDTLVNLFLKERLAQRPLVQPRG